MPPLSFSIYPFLLLLPSQEQDQSESLMQFFSCNHIVIVQDLCSFGILDFCSVSSLVFSLQVFCTVCFLVRITRPHDHIITYSQPLPNDDFTSTSIFCYPDSSIVDSSLASNKRHQSILPGAFEYFKLLGSLSTRGFAPGKSHHICHFS